MPITETTSTDPTVQKVIKIEGTSKALDAITKEAAPPTTETEVKTEEKKPEVKPEVKAEDDIIPIKSKEEKKDGSEKKEGEEKPDPKGEQKSDQKTDEEKRQEKVLDEPEDDEEIDLAELSIEVDGKNRTVDELLKEADVLRQQFAEIAKDPFLKGFIEHYMATGNASAYLEAKGVDWDKKDDLEVLRDKFDREYADLDPKIREKAWRREIADKYKIKPDLTDEEKASDDYEIAQGFLKRDASKARGEFKETQKKFQVVDRKPEENKPQQQFDPVAYKKQVLAERDVDSFMKNKLLKLGIKNDSGTSFGFEPTNPAEIIEMMVDDRKFLRTFFDFDKRIVDRIKQAKIYAYAPDPDGFEQQLVDFGKDLGLEERLKEVKNTDERLNKKADVGATKGTFAKEFLTAALRQRK